MIGRVSVLENVPVLTVKPVSSIDAKVVGIPSSLLLESHHPCSSTSSRDFQSKSTRLQTINPVYQCSYIASWIYCMVLSMHYCINSTLGMKWGMCYTEVWRAGLGYSNCAISEQFNNPIIRIFCATGLGEVGLCWFRGHRYSDNGYYLW